MAVQSAEFSEATPADLAADMQHHRATWLGFLRIAKWVVVGAALLLVVVFFVELSVRSTMLEEGAALGGAPPLPGE